MSNSHSQCRTALQPQNNRAAYLDGFVHASNPQGCSISLRQVQTKETTNEKTNLFNFRLSQKAPRLLPALIGALAICKR